mgnify:CR=1 FL=1
MDHLWRCVDLDERSLAIKQPYTPKWWIVVSVSKQVTLKLTSPILENTHQLTHYFDGNQAAPPQIPTEIAEGAVKARANQIEWQAAQPSVADVSGLFK